MIETTTSLARADNRMKHGGLWGVIRAGACAILILAALFFLACSYLDAWHAPWLEQRMVPTLALALGQTVYHMPGSGPLLSTTYAPISYLIFLPAALFSHVLPIFATGSLMSTLLLLLPLYLALRFFTKREGLSQVDASLLFVFGFVAIVLLRPFNYVISTVDPDAPAICFMALSLLLLYWNRPRPRRTVTALSSCFLVLSIGCKQNMLIAGILVLLIVLYFFGRGLAGRYLAWTLFWGLCALTAVAMIYGDLRIVYFNNVTIPAHIHVEKGSLVFGAYEMYEYGAPLVFFVIGAVLLWFLSAARSPGANRRPCRFLWAFFAVAAAMAPVSVRTYAIVGGDANAFSHALYFLLLGAVLTISEILLASPSNAPSIQALEFWTIVCAGLLLASGVPMRFNRAWIAMMRKPLPAVEAYRYDKLHPGAVYFPSNSVATYLAEGKLYETDWGVLNLTVAGQSLSRQDLLRYVPAGAKYLAVPRGIVQPSYLYPFFAPHQIAARVPGLENFQVYLLER